MPASPEPNEKHTRYKQMTELKKRIQLVEAERKACYEDSESERKKNKEKCAQLQKEVKQLQAQRKDFFKCDEKIIRKTCDQHHVEGTVTFKNKSKEEVASVLDMKVYEAVKKLDIYCHQKKQKQKKLEGLLAQSQQLAEELKEKEKETIVDTPEGKKLSSLENHIHKVMLKMTEAQHISKKYKSIQFMLNQENTSCQKELERIEEQIKKHETEADKFKSVNQVAQNAKDVARVMQQRQEEEILSVCKDRERNLQEYRNRAEERRAYLDTLEKKVFIRRPSIRKDSVGPVPDDETQENVRVYEQAFQKLKQATGMSDTREIIQRFEMQKDTSNHLQHLQVYTDKELKELMVEHDHLQTDMELVKYSGGDTNIDISEVMKNYKNQIQQQQQQKYEADVKAQTLCKLISAIKEALEYLLHKINKTQGLNPSPQLIGANKVLEVLSMCDEAVVKLISKLGDINFEEKTKELSAMGLEPGLSPQIPFAIEQHFFPGEQQPVSEHAQPADEGVQSGDDEEILTRSFLKRQAQLIIDAKNRKRHRVK